MSWVDDFSFYLTPIDLGSKNEVEESRRYDAYVDVHTPDHFPDIEEADIVILGVEDGRRAGLPKADGGSDAIRSEFYGLFHHGNDIKIVDLGDIKGGKEPYDTDAAVKKVVETLIDHNIPVVIIGASQDITYPAYSAYHILETTVNLAVIDFKVDLGEFRDDLSSENYLSKIVIHDPSYLFNLSVLGYQTYQTNPATLELIDKLYFDAHRLGVVANDLKMTEPLLRNADVVSFDLNAVSNQALSGTHQPNGFSGEAFCQMARYAGLSDKATCVGFYNYRPDRDTGGQGAALVAQALWCLLDGFSYRQKEFPFINKKQFVEFKVQMPNEGEHLSFYKSKRTDKWWMNVPYSSRAAKRKLNRHHIVPCSYQDYEVACKGEVPDMWWRTYQKLG